MMVYISFQYFFEIPLKVLLLGNELCRNYFQSIKNLRKIQEKKIKKNRKQTRKKYIQLI